MFILTYNPTPSCQTVYGGGGVSGCPSSPTRLAYVDDTVELCDVHIKNAIPASIMNNMTGHRLLSTDHPAGIISTGGDLGAIGG